jgi:uncharacterized protein YcaQ
MNEPETISPTVYRRYILGKQGLWPGRRWAGRAGTDSALRSVEAVQVDPVSIVAPSRDIALWGRVDGYRPQDLDELMYSERRFFDYGGIVRIYPMEELPYWRVMMERRRSAERWVRFCQARPGLVEAVRQAVRERGPLRSRDLEGKKLDHYRSSRDSGVALYYLWLTGELMTYRREGLERSYDFLENVAPPERQVAATEPEAVKFFTRKAISQHGMVSLRDFRLLWQDVVERRVELAEARSELARRVEAGELAAVRIEGQAEPSYFPAADTGLLAGLQNGALPPAWQPACPGDDPAEPQVTFLSPLETVSARGRARALFGFDYIWEIYKPAAKRSYGPYTMPVLYGDRLVARLDARHDRPNKTLVVNGFWLEPWFVPDPAFSLAFDEALADFARFLGAERCEPKVKL